MKNEELIEGLSREVSGLADAIEGLASRDELDARIAATRREAAWKRWLTVLLLLTLNVGFVLGIGLFLRSYTHDQDRRAAAAAEQRALLAAQQLDITASLKILQDATSPGGKLYERGQANQAKVVGQLISALQASDVVQADRIIAELRRTRGP